MGLVALGGGAVGRWVLAGSGLGAHVLSYARQDPFAAAFFCQRIPSLRAVFPLGSHARAGTKEASDPE